MTVFVCGLGRCGTSLLMSMLAAGGMPTAGTAPDFECNEAGETPICPDWLNRQAGKAVKILDPQRVKPINPLDGATVIWIDRNTKEQAQSIFKLLRFTTTGKPPRADKLRRHERKILQRSLRDDRIEAMNYLHSIGASPTLFMRFEEILEDPRGQARRIAGDIGWRTGYVLDIAAMAAKVLPRSTECMPDLSIELIGAAAAGG